MSVFKSLRVIGIAALSVVALTGAHIGFQQMRGNFHEVIPGELYRAAQPDGASVARYAETYGVRTILNLRNEKRGKWYTEEKSAAALHGVEVIDFPMSSSEELSVEDSARLAEIMASAPKPLLIHCEHGSNRTGLASAIYVGSVAKRGELFAELQLSPYYGHVPIKGIGRYAMYKSWDSFEETLGF